MSGATMGQEKASRIVPLPAGQRCDTLEDFLQRRQAVDLKQGSLHKLVEDLWGPEEPYEPTVQDSASVYSHFTYSWIYESVMTAAGEKLTKDSLPRQQHYMTCYSSGKRVSKALQLAMYERGVWDALLGCEVKSRLDDDSRGTLRWVGVPQQGKYSRMMAGIEWSVAPKLRETERNGATNPFFDGAAYGEHMFTPEKPGVSTLEEPDSIELMIAVSNGLPAPPVPQSMRLLKLLVHTLKENFIYQVPYVIASLVGRLSGPIVLQHYVRYLESPDKTWSFGLFLVLFLFLTSLLATLGQHRNFYFCLQAASQFRSALTTSIFEKCFTVSVKSLSHPAMHAGRVINMLSTDVEHAYYFFMQFDSFFTIPTSVMLSVIMLCNLVGHVALYGLAVILFFGGLNSYMMKQTVVLEEQLSAARDKRIKATNEFLSGIRVTKFMAWEHRFISEIQSRREIELGYIRSVQLYETVSAFLGEASPSFMIAVVFISYHLEGHDLTPSIVFPTIALLGVLCEPFRHLPWLVTEFLRFMISLNRLTRFFECENTPYTTVEDIEQLIGERGSRGENSEDDPAIVMENADLTAYVAVPLPKAPNVSTPLWRRILRVFLRCHAVRPPRTRPPLVGDAYVPSHEDSGAPAAVPEKKSKRWKKRSSKKKKKSKLEGEDDCFELEEKVLLHDVSVEVPRGKLTLVIGPTGSGKSTLMQSLLSQLEVTKGRVWATKSIAYVPQQPWIMNATVRDNILFFSEEREEDLKEALRVSQLETDLGLMASGLETEIGEKGINMSGGQKARVSLARAVYADREMYLLDDPLSALDAHVGERVVNECILGKLAGKTRVLATHQLHVLKHADHVIALGEKRVLFSGDRDSFLQSDVYHSLKPHSSTKKKDGKGVAGDDDDSASTSSDSSSADGEEGEGDDAKEKETSSGHLMTEEEKAVGSVPLSTYLKYFQYCGGLRVIGGVLGVFGVTELLTVSSTIWLSLWSTDALGLSVSTYLKWYVILIALGAITVPSRFFVCFTTMREGSRNLHKATLTSVSCATMEFFDTTPAGRLLNRFSRDVDVTDFQLPGAMIGVAECVCTMLSSMAIMMASAPAVVLFFLPAGYAYYRILQIYTSANREIRRFSSIIRSPIYSIIGEVTNGLATVTAYGKTTVMMKRAVSQLELIARATLLEVTTNRWLAVRVELGAATLIAVLAFSGVFVTMRSTSSRNIALMSLALTISLQITTTLNWLVRHVATVEADMNSIERLVHYIDNIPHEDMPELSAEVDAMSASHTGKVSAVVTDAAAVGRSGSPVITAGSMEFRRVQMRYRDGLPLVLRDVSFRIAPREKVGVVGRTGSGKSTLMLTFMRMVDICGGEILVNGSGIRTYPLRELRKQFSMIPQDPVLFDGTVRQNLDPFLESSVDEVWEALTLCGLRERVESEVGGLDARVLEGGSNFSVGQRQLLCMARALLRKGSGFILMDEATANIDPALDRYIQGTVMNAFAEYTVITIAHRLHTVANYDKIIVMDQGIVAEIGTPRELVSNRQSVFRGMVESMGEAGMSEFMHLLEGGNEESAEGR